MIFAFVFQLFIVILVVVCFFIQFPLPIDVVHSVYWIDKRTACSGRQMNIIVDNRICIWLSLPVDTLPPVTILSWKWTQSSWPAIDLCLGFHFLFLSLTKFFFCFSFPSRLSLIESHTLSRICMYHFASLVCSLFSLCAQHLFCQDEFLLAHLVSLH